jgi:hypothetical protein
MKWINLFFYYQWIYRRIKNYRRKIHRQSISIGKLITDEICVLCRRKNSVGKTVKSCSGGMTTFKRLYEIKMISFFPLIFIVLIYSIYYLLSIYITSF